MKRFQIILIALTTALLCACATVAPTTTQLEWAGSYTVSSSTLIDHPGGLTGKMSRSTGVKLERRTTQIAASLGTRFGVGYVFHGASTDASVQQRIVWYFPQGGLTNPVTKRTADSETWNQTCRVETPCSAGQVFKESWGLVPGRYAVEVWVKEQLVVRQDFDVSINHAERAFSCTFRGFFSPMRLSWDLASRQAVLVDEEGEAHDGRLVGTRPHNDDRKFNLRFTTPPDDLNSTIFEFIVFWIPGVGHKVIGIGLAPYGEELLFSRIVAQSDAECLVVGAPAN